MVRSPRPDEKLQFCPGVHAAISPTRTGGAPPRGGSLKGHAFDGDSFPRAGAHAWARRNTCLVEIQTSGVGYGAAIPLTVTTLAPQWNQLCSVDHFTSVNLYAGYNITDHVQVHGAITNLFNTQPPVNLETYGGGALYRYTTLNQDGAVGRFFLLGAIWRF